MMDKYDANRSIDEHRAISSMPRDGNTDAEIREILSRYKKVAVIGMSREEGKASHEIPRYLIEKGYDVIPVNPNTDFILGRKSYKSIGEVTGNIDIVDVFRPSDQVLAVVKDAILKNPKVIWLQEGISNDEARKVAEESGILFVFNRCMMKEHIRLFGE
jgi:hypothetical protein